MIFLILLVVNLFYCNAGYADESSSFGVCAHISRHSDHALAAKECELMSRVGIGWVRTDFDWTTVDPREDVWDYSLIDETVDIAESHGITILPILCYDVPWASPAYKHMDKWLEYVRNTVNRYKDRLRYWEVWNEQDGEGFWRDTPRPEDYTALLKATYNEIKKIDPELTVLIGGFSGIPMEYIEGVYKAGGKDYFDIMVVHPYRYPGAPEQGGLYEDLLKLRTLMVQYGDVEKPLWITEIGWPTQENKAFVVEQVVSAGLKALGMNSMNGVRFGVLDDPGYPVFPALSNKQIIDIAGPDAIVYRLDNEQLKTFDISTYDVLIMCPEESVPEGVFDSIYNFVASGGVIVFPQGVPLYYESVLSDSGRWSHVPLDDSFRKRLHIGWEAWWTNTKVPEEAGFLAVPKEYVENITSVSDFPSASRFLNDSNLRTDDTFIPLVTAQEGGYNGVVSGVYDYNSELKGAAIISCLFNGYRGVSEQVQAEIIPRAYLLSMLAGVEKVFWYNLRAREVDRYYNEDNFGIIHKDLSPKPAYKSVKTLSSMWGGGSVFDAGRWQYDNIYCPGWHNPEGDSYRALWSVGSAVDVMLNADSDIVVIDSYGNKLRQASCGEQVSLQLGQTIIYVVGKSSLVFE